MLARAEAVWRHARALGNHRGMRSLITGLMIVFSAVFLGGMLWYYWPTLIAYRWEFNPRPLLVGCILYSLDLLLAVLGWGVIMRQMTIDISLRKHLRIYFFTRAVGRIPGLPWNLASRAVLYKRLGVNLGIIGVATALELLLVIVAGLLSGVLIWFALPSSVQLKLVWLVPVLASGLVLMHPSVIQMVLKRLGNAEGTFGRHYWEMLFPLGIFILEWIIGGSVLYTVILTLYPLPLTMLPGIIGAWSLSGAATFLLFFSPTSFGIKEIALSLLLALFVPAGLAVIVAILARLFLTAMEFAWAIATSRL